MRCRPQCLQWLMGFTFISPDLHHVSTRRSPGNHQERSHLQVVGGGTTLPHSSLFRTMTTTTQALVTLKEPVLEFVSDPLTNFEPKIDELTGGNGTVINQDPNELTGVGGTPIDFVESPGALTVDEKSGAKRRGVKSSEFFKGKNDRGMFVFHGEDQDDMIRGSKLNDRIIGNNGNDIIKAGKGNDIIIGGGGNDTLSGGDGKDWLIGGSGNDELIGGSDADTFFVNKGNNVILDFNFSEGDCLRLGKSITNVSYEQDGNNVLLRSDQGLTTILNNEVSDFL